MLLGDDAAARRGAGRSRAGRGWRRAAGRGRRGPGARARGGGRRPRSSLPRRRVPRAPKGLVVSVGMSRRWLKSRVRYTIHSHRSCPEPGCRRQSRTPSTAGTTACSSSGTEEGHRALYPARALRLACPCAVCVEEMSGRGRCSTPPRCRPTSGRLGRAGGRLRAPGPVERRPRHRDLHLRAPARHAVPASAAGRGDQRTHPRGPISEPTLQPQAGTRRHHRSQRGRACTRRNTRRSGKGPSPGCIGAVIVAAWYLICRHRRRPAVRHVQRAGKDLLRGRPRPRASGDRAPGACWASPIVHFLIVRARGHGPDPAGPPRRPGTWRSGWECGSGWWWPSDCSLGLTYMLGNGSTGDRLRSGRWSAAACWACSAWRGISGGGTPARPVVRRGAARATEVQAAAARRRRAAGWPRPGSSHARTGTSLRPGRGLAAHCEGDAARPVLAAGAPRLVSTGRPHAGQPSLDVGEGTDVGLIGGLVVAVWFLILDTIAGHPFQTPSLLGQMVLFGDRRPIPARSSSGPSCSIPRSTSSSSRCSAWAWWRWCTGAIENPVVRYALLPVFLVFEVMFYGLLRSSRSGPTSCSRSGPWSRPTRSPRSAWGPISGAGIRPSGAPSARPRSAPRRSTDARRASRAAAVRPPRCPPVPIRFHLSLRTG